MKETDRQRIERQIENVLVAKAMMDSLPDRAIYPRLGDWANREMRDSDGHACGSAACFGGWVALHPHFQKQGVRVDTDGAPYLKGGPDRSPAPVPRHLFGAPPSTFWHNCSGTSDRVEVDRRLQEALDRLVVEAFELEELP